MYILCFLTVSSVVYLYHIYGIGIIDNNDSNHYIIRYKMVELPEAAREQMKPLDEDEEVIGSYECRIDFMRGFLLCTNKGIQFIQGGGNYERCFNNQFDAPYSKLDVGEEANTNLVLTIDGEAYRKRLEPIGEPIQFLENMLKSYVRIHEMPTPCIQDMRINH